MSAVVDIAWSPRRAGVLAVASSQSRSVNFYSTIRPPTEAVTRVPIHSITVTDPIRSLSWQQQSPQSIKMSSGGVEYATGSGSGSGSGTSGSGLQYPLPGGGKSRNKSGYGTYSASRSCRLLISTSGGFADVDVVESIGLGVGACSMVAVGSAKAVDVTRGWCTPPPPLHPPSVTFISLAVPRYPLYALCPSLILSTLPHHLRSCNHLHFSPF